MMTPWIQETRNGFEIAEEEINRLEASPAQGEQSCAVQSDMKAWALKSGLWPNEPYKNMIVLHAIDRGWLQEYVDGMEIVY
jgi:hypothetical protein